MLAQYNPEPGTCCGNLFNMGESTPSPVSPLAQAALPSPGPEIMAGSLKERKIPNNKEWSEATGESSPAPDPNS